MNRKHYVLSILGMQCVDCENNIHEAILALPGILSAYASFTDELLQIEIDTDIISIKTVRAAIKQAGYDTFFPVRKQKSLLTKRLLLTLLAAAGIFFLFQLNQLIPLDISLEKVEKDVQYGLIFMVGLLTSFHCIGMCGGFVLSYTATVAKSGHSPHFSHLSYGLAKTLSYTAFGAAFGFVGGAISFTLTMRSVAMLCAGIFLVIYGLGMLDTFHSLRRFQIRLPRHFVHALTEQRRHTSNPFVIGLLNGLMITCGPLQAMYVLAAGTGDPLQGAAMLAVFSLGTLPLMFVLGYLASVISLNITRSFLKISSLIMILLGATMINRSQVILDSGYDVHSLVLTGTAKLKTQLSNWDYLKTEAVASFQQGYQVIYTEVEKDAYLPEEYILRKNVPVKWIIHVKELSPCNRQIIVPSLDMTIDLKMGLQVVEFIPEKLGVMRWSCYMGMIPGRFIVSD
jgi:sulfite exporter TauE/SafE/copper chaperone CopZ